MAVNKKNDKDMMSANAQANIQEQSTIMDDLSISINKSELFDKYGDTLDLKNTETTEDKISAIDISQITKYISEKYSTEHNDQLFLSLLDAIGRGNNKLVQNMLEQSLTIKTDWIDAIQEGIQVIERIISKPKLSLRDERELVKVERAKRVDSVAVRHLSTHTQYIKVIKKDGSVIPSTIMTRNLEEEKAIYENRFLYALLQRMRSFVEKRYNIIVDYAKVKDNTVLSYVSSFKYGSAAIDYKLNIDVKTDKELTQAQADNTELLKKIKIIREQILALESSSFMKAMKTAKPVYPPIQRTNILTSNPEYSLCYKLWMMLSSYNTVGYSVNIIEKQLPFDGNYFEDLTKIVATSAQVMLTNNKVREAIYAQVEPSKAVQKEFKVGKNVSFLTNVFNSKYQGKNKDVNDYYYERMKSMILHLNNLADALAITSESEVPKKALFKNIYTQVQKLNNDMYSDILKFEYLENEKSDADKLEIKYRMQKKLCERYTQLKQLKEDEAQKATLKEQAQLKKLDTLYTRLQKKKQAEQIKAEKAKILKQKKILAKQKAEEAKRQKQLAKAKRAKEREQQRAKKLKEQKKKKAKTK